MSSCSASNFIRSSSLVMRLMCPLAREISLYTGWLKSLLDWDGVTWGADSPSGQILLQGSVWGGIHQWVQQSAQSKYIKWLGKLSDQLHGSLDVLIKWYRCFLYSSPNCVLNQKLKNKKKSVLERFSCWFKESDKYKIFSTLTLYIDKATQQYIKQK